MNARNERASTRVARNIASDIQARQLPPGTKLDSEHLMIEKQGASRATVREALRYLELQGALQMKAGPGGGPVVSVPSVDHLAGALSLQLQFANATFRSVLEARRSIYPVLVAEAAEHASDDDIAALRESLKRLAGAIKDSDATTREVRHFYELVAAASKNLVLGFMVNALHHLSEDSGIEYDVQQRQASARQADKIFRAIEQRDPEQALVLSKQMHAAARRYWEKHAPDLLNAPVSWVSR
jgi:DNA-binding FadR family transcriptional regulator